MKFEEKQDSILTFKKDRACYVYFLLQGEEVVYVGQTSVGLSRPFAHTDKEYDTIKVIPVKPEGLDCVEDYFINKYKPKYNKKRNDYVVYSLQRVKRIIKSDFDLPKFNLWELKKALNALNITPTLDGFKDYKCITEEQFRKVYQFVKKKVAI